MIRKRQELVVDDYTPKVEHEIEADEENGLNSPPLNDNFVELE